MKPKKPLQALKKSVSILLVLLMLVGLFTIVPFGALAGISYIERSWNGSKVVETARACTDYINVKDLRSSPLRDGGWYVVTEDTTINSRIYLYSGTANLILCDGATLTAKGGIGVFSSATLNIYGQSGDTGKLYAHVEEPAYMVTASYAAIGGTYTSYTDKNGAAGNINIHGGTIDVQSNEGAGIGGCSDSNASDNTIKIYGGAVTALSAYGAGIGGGYRSENNEIDIYGGTVAAFSNGSNTDKGTGAGVGSGSKANQSRAVNIYGGSVIAQGVSGAGIGSGYTGNSTSINITGGVILAYAVSGAGIGSGQKGDSSSIKISNASVTALAVSADNSSDVKSYIERAANAMKKNSSLLPSLPSSWDFNSIFDFVKDILTFSGIKVIYNWIKAYFDPSSGAGFGAGIGGGDQGKALSIVISDSNVVARGGYQGAGIGNGKLSEYGDIYIDNSVIEAAGGDYGSGIGGGNESKPTGEISIVASTVTAHGGTDSAGIGTPNECGKSGSISISRSTVVADSAGYAAGIGGGDDVDGGYVYIYDSDVKAYGGKDAAGIGGGEGGAGGFVVIEHSTVYARGNHYGAGIGGGEDEGSEHVSIYDSTVEAVAGDSGNCVAIGNGDYNSFFYYRPSVGLITFSDNLKVNAGKNSGDTSTYRGTERKSAVSNWKYAYIYPCDHAAGWVWRYYLTSAHAKYCTDCGGRISAGEPHQWNSDYICTLCGAAGEPTKLRFIERDNDGEVVTEVTVPKNSYYTVPECTVAPDGMEFVSWRPSAWASSWSWQPGDEVEIGNSRLDVEAVYLRVIDVPYIAENGSEQTVKARVIDQNVGSSEILPEGWYVFDDSYDDFVDDRIPWDKLQFMGNFNLILLDGQTIDLTSYKWGYHCIEANSRAASLTVYGQREQTGTVKIYSLMTPRFKQYGGNITTPNSCTGSYGTLIAKGTYDVNLLGVSGDDGLVISGGNVRADWTIVSATRSLQMGWTELTDSINLGAITMAGKVEKHGTISVADGQALTDGENIYTGTLTEDEITAINNKTLTPYTEQYSVKKVWDTGSNRTLHPDAVKAVVQQYRSGAWTTVKTVTLSAENNWKADTGVFVGGSSAPTRVRELGPDKEDGSDGDIIYLEGDAEYQDSGEDDKRPVVTYSFTSGGYDYSLKYRVSLAEDEDHLVTITNTMDELVLNVEKDWDIDLEGNDRPDSVQMLVQAEDNGTWQNMQMVTLSSDNGWKAAANVPQYRAKDGEKEEIEYRVRELKEESLYNEFMSGIKDLVEQGKDTYDEWLETLKTEGVFYALPADVRTAAEESYESLLETLNATTQNLYDKLIAVLEFEAVGIRVVYDEDDDDKPDGDDVTANRVTYNVGEYTSVVSGGTVDAHATTYQVKYENSGNDYTVTNQAIQVIDLYKRWIQLGADDDDMPDSAWLVLMCKPSSGALDNAKTIASAAGVDLGDVLDYEFPVIDPIEGGTDPISVISKLVAGVDLSFLTKLLGVPKLGIVRVTEDDDWKATIVDSKYTAGLPKEYKGAELGSEAIRQIIKYLTHIDLPISYNPFDNYISVPTKAIPALRWLDVDDLDLSALIAAGKSISAEDLENLRPEDFVFDKTKLMANVINVKVDIDSDDDDDDDTTLNGKKVWEGDAEENRPDWIKIHVKDGGDEVDGSPITLSKSDFSGKNTWEWSLDVDGGKNATYTVSEEYPENYAYKDNYTCVTDGYNLTNTWSDTPPETVTICGLKMWKDNGDADGIRPDSITVRLYADGEEVSSVEINEQCGWKYFFPDKPVYKTDGGNKTKIVYTVQEDDVEGYEAQYNGYNIINKRVAELGELTITATRGSAEKDKEQSFIYQVQGPDGGSDTVGITAVIVLKAGETSGSVTIAQLPVGEYAVTEERRWSWRYSDGGSKTVTVAKGTAEVTFDHEQSRTEWMGGYSHRTFE